MMRFVNLLQPFLDHVGINLRSGNVRMAEHKLDRPQIGATLQKVRRKTMPKHMRLDGPAQTCTPPVRRQNLPDTDAAERASPAIYKKRRTAGGFAFTAQLRPGQAEILFNHAERFASHGHDAFLVALPDAAYAAHLGVQVRDPQADQL